MDTFFWMSGLLSTLGLLKCMDQSTSTLKFLRVHCKFVAARWLRLTPLYAFVLAWYELLQTHMGGGPVWGECRKGWGTDDCQTDWWANLLYINNLYPSLKHSSTCMGHSWYLANDMQFSFMLPLLVWVYLKRTWMGLAGVGVLMAGALGYNVIVFQQHHLTPLISLHPNDEYFQLVYIKPWARIGAYLIGVLTAYLYDWSKSNTATWQPLVKGYHLAGMWGTAGAVMLTCVFVTKLGSQCVDVMCTEGGWGQTWDTVYGSFSHVAWTGALSLIALMCFSGQGGGVEAFLGTRAFQAPAKLSYAAYLVHPMVILTLYCSQTVMLTYTGEWYALTYIGICVYTAAAAGLLWVFVEQPAASILMQKIRDV